MISINDVKNFFVKNTHIVRPTSATNGPNLTVRIKMIGKPCYDSEF